MAGSVCGGWGWHGRESGSPRRFRRVEEATPKAKW